MMRIDRKNEHLSFMENIRKIRGYFEIIQTDVVILKISKKV